MGTVQLPAFKEFTTDRLHLRALTPDDAELLYQLHSSEVVGRYLRRPKAASVDGRKQFIEKILKGMEEQWYYWAMTLHHQPDLVGTICLWNFNEDKTIAEVGYEQLPAYFGKGLMQEGLQPVFNFGFEQLQLTAIQAHVHQENAKSIKLLERNHFTRFGEKEDNWIYRRPNPF